MKTILALFALVLICTQAVSFSHTNKDNLPGGWRVRDPQEFMRDSRNQETLEIAKEQFISEASQADEISSNQLTIQEVKKVSTQVVSGLNIRFKVDLVDADGKVYDVTLVVWSQPWNNFVKLTEYFIN